MNIPQAKQLFGTAAIIGVLAFFGIGEAFAQAQNGRGEGKNRVGVSYYKTPPGKQDEWLALYKKYHRPIMQYQLDHGVTLSSTIYAAGNHAPGSPWDFAIINVSPPPGQAPSLGISRPELIVKLFPDQDDYVRGEKRRWELTIDHWDERFVELDIDREPFSVYWPILPEEGP